MKHIRQLTERELDVARLLDNHLTFEEIAGALGISRRTVKAYSDGIRVKMGIKRSRDIPRVLKQLGLL